jgi:hypothetical protein
MGLGLTTRETDGTSPRPSRALRERLAGGLGPRGRVVVLLVIIVALGVVLRCHALSTRSFWFDEAFSWRLIEFPFAEMLQRDVRDNHPPLYFALLKAWAAVFGASPLAIRALSVLFGATTILGAYLFTVEAMRRPGASVAEAARFRGAGLLAAALIAVNVFQVRWGWEARMYTLGTTLALFSSWALFRALRASEAAFRPWVLYGVLALLFAYTHYYALFTLTAQALFAAGYLLIEARGRPRAVWNSNRFWNALGAACIAVVGWLPWLPAFLAQYEQVREAYWSLPVRPRDLAEACGRLFLAPENGAIGKVEGWTVAAFCVAFLLALLWRPRAGTAFVFLAAVLPVAAPVLLSLAGIFVFTPRYLAIAQVFLLVGMAVVLTRPRSTSVRAVLGAWAVVVFLGASLAYRLDLDVEHKPGVRGAAAWLDGQRRRGEPVVVASPLFYVPLTFYTAERADCYVYRRDGEVLHYEGGAVIEPEEILNPGGLRTLASRRVWAVDMRGGGWGVREVPPPPGWVVRARHRFPEAYDVQGEVIVVEYQSPGPSIPFPVARTP